MYICTTVHNANAILLLGRDPPLPRAGQNHTIYKGNDQQEAHVTPKLFDYPDNEDLSSSLNRCFYN